MANDIQNPNDPSYWSRVKASTSLRNANAAFKTESAKVRVGMIYEAYIAELAVLVSSTARTFGLSAFPGSLQAFRNDCANLMHIPELAETDAADLVAEGEQATRDAAEALYGA